MALPTLNEVIIQYMFGGPQIPTDFSNEAIIRDSAAKASIDILVSDYMSQGAGRFALASNFELMSLGT